MSAPCTRLLCVPTVAAASRRTLSNHSPHRLLKFTRWQSTKTSRPGGFRAGRFAAYTLTTAGLALGGSLAYANYDPVFKNQANEIVPGFAQLTDTVADLFVDRIGSGRSRGGTTRDNSGSGRASGVGGSGSEDRAMKRSKFDESVVNPSSHPKQEDGNTHPVSQTKDQEDETHEEHEPTTSSVEAAPIPVQSEVRVENGEARVDVEVVKEDGGKSESVMKEVEGEGVKESVVEDVKEDWGKGEGVMEKVEGEGVKEEDAKGEVVSVGEKGEGVSDVERVVEEVKGEVNRVAGEVREEKVRELQEAQMADKQLSWLKDSAQVEKRLEETLQEFVSQADQLEEAQNNVLTHSQEHSRLMKGIASGAPDELQEVYETADAVYKGEEAVQVSLEALRRATDEHTALLQRLSEVVDRARELGLKTKAEEVLQKKRECMRRMVEGSAAVQQAEVERELLQDYWKRAQRDREQLQRELGQELPEGDSKQEAVLVMLGRRVEVLKRKLQDVEKDHQERLTAALEKQKDSLEQLATRTLEWKLTDKDMKLHQELRYQADKMYRDYQSELREQLKRQTDSHNHILADALNTQAEQLAAKWSGELELKLTKQESHYQRELALILSRLRGIEYMVSTISAAGNETKRQQGMRAACDSLHMALKSASASPDPDERYSLQREVNVLRDAARDDPFILAVLGSLPDRAVSATGIQGEGGLKERFSKVKRICRRVALVPEIGGGMGTYALSYMQSLLVVSWRFVGRITRDAAYEDLEKSDTFDILERADACLRCGDIELAVRYVNLLRGESRNVARDWLCDARNYLETLQAVQLVSEYMAALNITSSSVPAADK